MIKKLMIEKTFNLILIIFFVFVISFSTYAYISFKIETNSLKESLNIIKDNLNNKLSYDYLTSKADKLFNLALVQIIAFLFSSLSLIFLLRYVFKLYSLEKQSSYIDVLTEVYNKRAMKVALEHELTMAKKSKQPLSLAIIDVDYFKRYNDIVGHLIGDSALHKIANILKENLKEGDILGRIGGEEFLVIFPETDAQGAFGACEKLRKEVEKHYFRGESKLPNKKLTISAGISCYNPIINKNKKIKEETLLEEADKKLYEAKHFGRNIVKF